MSPVREISIYRKLLLAVLSVLVGIVLVLVILEAGLRLLPVSYPPMVLPVDDDNRIARYEKNVRYTWSKGWDFAIKASKQTNNYGFVNDIDYQRTTPGALMAVIGDSYVEAQQVSNMESVAGILAGATGDRGHIYSLAMSGAPLSRYLAYAAYARKEFSPDSMVFVIIGNDYDESLAKYGVAPRFYQFFENDSGALTLEYTRYHMPVLKGIIRKSAFARYLIFNLEAKAFLDALRNRGSGTVEYVGNVRADFTAKRLEDSKRVVREFLDRLPAMSGLPSDRILFVMDGVRPSMYSEQTMQQARKSYVYLMREYFIEIAHSMGHEIVDMQPIFEGRYRADGSHFEFQTDGHWNQLGHAMVAEQIMNSAVYRGTIHTPVTSMATQ